MQYASKSQAENGVDNTTIMTPLRVKQSIAANGITPETQTDYDLLTNKPKINNVELTGNKSSSTLGLQETLVSGTNIKTINNESLLGSGNITVSGGSGISGVTLQAGTADVNATNSNNKAVISLYPATWDARYNPTSNRVLTEAALDDYTPTSGLATVATSGSYSDLSNKPTIPTNTSDLNNDSNFAVDASYVHTDNNYTTTEKNKLSGIASGAEVNVQSDWNETSSSNDAYIKNKPTIPTVNNATLTIQKNGTTVKTFTANASTDVTANITVPTNTSDLTNDGETGTNSYLEKIGTNLKLLGINNDGRLYFEYGTSLTDITLANLSDIPTIPTATSDLTNDGDGRTIPDPLFPTTQLSTSYSFITGSNNGFLVDDHALGAEPRLRPIFSSTISNKTIAYTADIPTNVSELSNDVGYITGYTETDPVFAASAAHGISSSDITDWNAKQEALVSGTNIKTINNQSILGSGNLTIGGSGGTSDYDQLSNRPQINSVTLTGNKSLSDLSIASSTDVGTLSSLTTTDKTSVVNAINEVNSKTTGSWTLGGTLTGSTSQTVPSGATELYFLIKAENNTNVSFPIYVPVIPTSTIRMNSGYYMNSSYQCRVSVDVSTTSFAMSYVYVNASNKLSTSKMDWYYR